MTAARPVPVTVLTGHLGAGKTTLLNRILSEDHGRCYAVVINEFGELGVDGDLVVGAREEVVEMNNGCVCCSVRSDLLGAVTGLLDRWEGLDGIIVETTGMAAPGPVAQTFLMDAGLRARTRLDAVVAVVDAKHLPLRLEDSPEAREQIAFADAVVVNKVDLVDAPALARVEAEVRALNPHAPLQRVVMSRARLDFVLGRDAFNAARPPALTPTSSGHAHMEGVASVSLEVAGPLDVERFHRWIASLLVASGEDILRAKGVLAFEGEDRRYAFHPVHMIWGGELLDPWPPDAERRSRLVLIGRRLDVERLRANFEGCHAR